MFNRPFLFLGVLAASAIIPYALNDPQISKTLRDQWQRWTSTSPQTPDFSGLGQAITNSETAVANAGSGLWSWLGSSETTTPPPIMPPVAPVIDFAEVLRLDMPPEFVIQRWPRVTTVLAEHDLQGLRVPLVTGPNVDDLTGSLTYYYDKQRVCQRLTFQGTTGDPRRLVMLSTLNYEMQQLPSLNAGLYVSVKSNKPESILQIDFAPVVKATNPSQAASVVVEINRPKSTYGISEDAKQRLLFHQRTNRW